FQCDQTTYRWGHGPRTSGQLHSATQGAAFRADMFRIDQLQPVPAEKAVEWFDRVIAQMLVIDRVEDHVVHQVDEVGDFEAENAVAGKQLVNAVGHVGEIVGVGKHVVGGDEGGGPALPADLPGELGGEERRHRLDAILRGALGDRAGRVNAEHAHALRLEKAQEGAVVAAELHDERSRGR